MADLEDVASSFRPKFDYFYAHLFQCPVCSTIWLRGYYEDFTDTPIEKEWGNRTWITRPIAAEDVETIRRQKGSNLDIDSFGAH